MSTSTKLLAIFKPGSHIDNAGNPIVFTESDVAATAAAYNPDVHKAPLVIGHPATNAPAYGWTKFLSFADGLLQASPDAVNAQFADWVNGGLYKKISASFYAPNSPVNPSPGVWYLRHIGFLGGHPPAIKGLPEPSFADADTDFITLEFAEENPDMSDIEKEKESLANAQALLDKQREELRAQQASFTEQEKKLIDERLELEAGKLVAKKREIGEFAESLIKEGRLLPKDKHGIIEFVSSLDGTTSIEFGEGDEKTKTGTVAWFKGFLSKLPKQIEFGERADRSNSVDFADASSLADAATAYQVEQAKLGKNVDDITAIQHVKNRR